MHLLRGIVGRDVISCLLLDLFVSGGVQFRGGNYSSGEAKELTAKFCRRLSSRASKIVALDKKCFPNQENKNIMKAQFEARVYPVTARRYRLLGIRGNTEGTLLRYPRNSSPNRASSSRSSIWIITAPVSMAKAASAYSATNPVPMHQPIISQR